MTFGPMTLLALAIAFLATVAWALCNWRPTLWPTLGMFFFGAVLALGVLVGGPLVRLP
jgi:hypothetical protein